MKANYLASPPLVVAYALAGRMDVDLTTEPLGQDRDGSDVYLRDLWPTSAEIDETIAGSVSGELFRGRYADVFTGDDTWRALDVPDRRPLRLGAGLDLRAPAAVLRRHVARAGPVEDVDGARCLVMLGDSVTTDHISPAGSIKPDGPAGQYLVEHGVDRKEFNSYGSRRGNHEVMVRGTFANVRLRNLLVPGSEGTWTVHLPGGEEMSIFDASARYLAEGTPLIVLAGKEYGTGSSRDWAAKGPKLLGVTAAIAESYERIHRSNLLMMGILPLQYRGRRERRVARADRSRALLDRRRRQRRGHRGRRPRGRHGVHRPRAPRHPARARLPPARRHPAVRAPPPARRPLDAHTSDRGNPLAPSDRCWNRRHVGALARRRPPEDPRDRGRSDRGALRRARRDRPVRPGARALPDHRNRRRRRRSGSATCRTAAASSAC